MVKPKKETSELKKVFYIDKVEFLRSMMEFALKAKGAEIYTVATLENNFYLLDDLEPDLILFDVESCKNHLDQLAEYRTKARLVGVGSLEERSLVSSFTDHFLTKPLEAKNIANRLLSLLD